MYWKIFKIHNCYNLENFSIFRYLFYKLAENFPPCDIMRNLLQIFHPKLHCIHGDNPPI